MISSAVDALRHAVPNDTEREPHDFPIDGVLPHAAFRPVDRQEVADLLRAASAGGLCVVPQGTRTALGLGRPLERYDVALSTVGLERIVEYVPEDLTITVEAGLTLRRLQQELAEHGQYLPVDPPPNDRVTIGGLLATARPGAWRGHLPAARDLILGATAVLPDGSLAHSGGRVVKNVSGYDLHRLHTGALGAFGVIVEASFKLAPLPPLTRSLALRCRDLREAGRLALALWDATLAARAITVVGPDAAAHAGLRLAPHVLVELAGVEPAVDRSTREVREATAQANAAVDEGADEPWRRLRLLAGDASATVLRLGVPPSAVAETVQAVEDLDCLGWAHVAAGAVLAHTEAGLDPDAVAQLRARAVALGGFLQVEAASTELRRRVDPFDAAEVELVRALRHQFDPGRVLNRGRWGEGL